MGVGAGATVTALALVMALLLPVLEEHPDLAAGWLGEQLGREVQLQEVEVAWRNGAPVLRLRGLQLGGREGLSLESTEVRVDPLASLRAGTLRPTALTVRGATIHLARQAGGSFTLGGLGAPRSPAGRTTPGPDAGLALALLPAFTGLRLEDGTVTVSGLPGLARAVVLAPVSLHLQRRDGQIRLAGAVTPAGADTTPARFTLRWPEGPGGPLDNADFTVSARELPLGALPLDAPGPSLGGRLTVDLDGRLAGGAVAALRGSATVTSPTLGRDGQPAPAGAPVLTAVESLLELRPTPRGWHLDLLRLQLRDAGGAWPDTRGWIEHRRDAGPPWQAGIAGVPVARLLPLLRELPLPGERTDELLAAVAPHGRVEDLLVVLEAGARRPRLARASLRNLQLRSADGRVAAAAVDATVSLGPDHGSVTLHRGRISAPALDDGPDLALAADGRMDWRRTDGTIELRSPGVSVAEGESRLQLSGQVLLPAHAGAATEVDVEVRSATLEVDRVLPFLRLGAVPPPLARWLGGAVAGGHLRGVSGRLKGSVRSAADIARVLDLGAAFDQMDIRYHPKWPRLERLSGEMRLRDAAFRFRVVSGEVSGARIVSAAGAIADVSQARPPLDLTATVTGASQHATAFISATPLAPRFPRLLKLLDAQGDASVELQMTVPTSGDSPTLSGTLALEDNTLQVPGLRSPLEKVNGRMSFDHGGLGTGALEAAYLGSRIDVALDGSIEAGRLTRLVISGRTDPRGLLRHLHDVGVLDSDRPEALPMLSRLEGETGWQVTLDIPRRAEGQREGIALTVSSDLEGMALRLPEPLGKSRTTTQPLTVRTRLAAADDRVFRVAFGEHVRAVLRASAAGAGLRFERGEVRFGGQPASLPPEPGLRVGGDVAALSVDDWVAFVALATGTGERDAGTVNPMGTVSGIDLDAKRVAVLGAEFEDVRVHAARAASGSWLIGVAGDGIDGAINVPWPTGEAPIEATFDFLHVRREAGAAPMAQAAEALTPADLPPVRLVVRRLRYNDLELGVAKLTVSRGPDGLLVEEIVAASETFEVHGSGTWAHQDGETFSHLDIRIYSGDIGALSATLGHGDSGLEGGTAEIDLRAGWTGSPFALALERVNGALRFKASGGRLRDVDPGATGRMFGLLNLTILPRRLLRLDFSDLFGEGITFDSVQGSFQLAGGHAYTDDTTMDTENARVDLIGRIGLVDQDYDQVMTVTPKLSRSLPLMPLWLAEKFLNRKLIDSAFSYRYFITGPWDDPTIERDRVEAVPSDAG
jgi:uncharacterized protein (TIGR02099 family)